MVRGGWEVDNEDFVLEDVERVEVEVVGGG